MTLSPGIPFRREKGQPEGSVVTGKTRKLRAEEKGLVPNDAAGQNNSNLASLTALVVNVEWELILAMSSHYCFIAQPQFRGLIYVTHVGLLNIFGYHKNQS